MEVLTKGHKYTLDNFESSEKKQELQFIHKEPTGENGDLKTISDGTTNEEVLLVLIDRLKFLHGTVPNTHTQSAIDHCEHALHELEARTADREERKVEGTHQS